MAIQINIRGVPEQVRDELAARAALQGKSMQEFLRAGLMQLDNEWLFSPSLAGKCTGNPEVWLGGGEIVRAEYSEKTPPALIAGVRPRSHRQPAGWF